MKVERDFKEVLELFEKHNVKYCIVGAFAFGLYAVPRYTKDMDILVKPEIENGNQILGALNDFGFGSLEITADDLCHEGQVIQLGYEPLRIDLITSIEGIGFDEIWENRTRANYGNIEVNFIGLDELIRTKKIAGRKQDLADLEKLEDGDE